MDTIDRMLLDLMQQAFPLSATPWQQLGGQVGISEEETIKRISYLKETGIIRRIGGILDTARMQFVSCLCAMRVPQNKMEQVATEINLCSGVTHNYQRESTYNLWFTLTTPSIEYQERQLKNWERQFGLPILRFPKEKQYKRSVQFSMRQAGEKK